MKAEPGKQSARSDAAILWLARLSAPDLSDSEQREFEKWLAASPENQLAYIKAEQLWERGGVLKNTVHSVESRNPSGYWLRPLWVVAGLLVCIGLFFAPSVFRTTPVFIKEYRTDIGKMRDVVLPDGSSVFLHAGTSIEVLYEGAMRSVQLTSGEAFFEVTKDEKRPFDVVTSHGRARVMGTAFSIDQNAEVTVLEGRVGLAQNKDTFEPLIVLESNQKLSVAAAAAGEDPLIVDANSELSWRNKQLVYRGEPLQVVIQDLEQFYGKKIIVAEDSRLNSNVVIVLQLSDFKSTVASLTGALGLNAHFSEDGEQVVLLTRQLNR